MDLRDTALPLPLNRGQYGLIGALLIVFGILLMIGTAFLVMQIEAQWQRKISVQTAGVTACAQALQDLGLQAAPDVGAERIIAQIDGIDGASSKMGRASAAALICPGWRMTGFCMGAECDNPNGLWLELRPG